MSAPAYTPGPWMWADGPDDDDMPRLVGAGGAVICDFGNATQYYPQEGSPPDEDNANLIAAAPTMADAIRTTIARHDALASEIEPGFTCGCQDCQVLGAALARAEGSDS